MNTAANVVDTVALEESDGVILVAIDCSREWMTMKSQWLEKEEEESVMLENQKLRQPHFLAHMRNLLPVAILARAILSPSHKRRCETGVTGCHFCT